jgi:hypothetical protein
MTMDTVNPAADNERLEAALRYAALGWHILPIHPAAGGLCSCGRGADCTSPGKHPLTPRGLKDATADPGAAPALVGERPRRQPRRPDGPRVRHLGPGPRRRRRPGGAGPPGAGTRTPAAGAQGRHGRRRPAPGLRLAGRHSRPQRHQGRGPADRRPRRRGLHPPGSLEPRLGAPLLLGGAALGGAAPPRRRRGCSTWSPAGPARRGRRPGEQTERSRRRPRRHQPPRPVIRSGLTGVTSRPPRAWPRAPATNAPWS